MVVMTPPTRAFTIDDLHGFPADGYRRELIQGSLHVNPAPNFRHQAASAKLHLVVEILSPSTRHHDRGMKRLAYDEAGIPSFWIVDLDEPSITVIEAGEERVVGGTHELVVEQPFPFTVHPADLVGSARS